MKRRRHSQEEISAKLSQADEMAEQGKSQTDIARALGISVMTFHRWRRLRPELPHSRPPPEAPKSVTSTAHIMDAASAARIKDLELENSQLRRLVTDLLLEKLKLQESRQERVPTKQTASRHRNM